VEYGLTFFLAAGLIVVLTGISKAGFGAGLEMMAVPTMALFIAPQVAAGIMLPILVTIDMANLWRYRKTWRGKVLKVMWPAAAIGIGAGAATFHLLNADVFRFGLGILCFIFIAHRLTQHALNKAATDGLPNWLIAILGAMGGFTSFVAHAGGPPVKMVLLSENLPPKEFVGTNSYLMAGINGMKLIPYFWLGQLSVQNLTTSVQLAPFMVVGIAVGFWLNSRVSADVFTKLIFVALAIIGAKLIYDSAPLLF